MDLQSKEVYEIIKRKGIKHFHHANTVTTSKSFMVENALLSREKVVELGYKQTVQRSDEKDKLFDVNNHIFLDGLDLSDYFGTPNVYGPVLFKFSIDILLHPDIPTVKITKQNPDYWNEKTPMSDRYYTSVEEFDKMYKTGNKLLDGRSCFTLTTTNGVLPFSYGLSQIVIDDPERLQDDRNVMDIIKDFLFQDIAWFKATYPNVKALKTIRNRSHLKNMTGGIFAKMYKIYD